MSKLNTLYLLVGSSGTGKTSIATALERKYGYRQLLSYTTRPMRNENETGHIFVNDTFFNQLTDFIGYTVYNSYKYGATSEQADKSDIYVIDPAGVEFLKNHYNGKPVKVITITSPVHTRINRMENRGDSFPNIMERIVNDIDFRNFVGDYNVENNDNTSLDDIVDKIHEYIEKTENEYGKDNS